jgi:hypothetical protein
MPPSQANPAIIGSRNNRGKVVFSQKATGQSPIPKRKEYGIDQKRIPLSSFKELRTPDTIRSTAVSNDPAKQKAQA